MNALLNIKTEVLDAKPVSDKAKANSSADSTGFSEALEKQVQSNQKSASTDKPALSKAEAKPANEKTAAKDDEQAAVNASEDGKKLPPEEKVNSTEASSEKTTAETSDELNAGDVVNEEVTNETPVEPELELDVTETDDEPKATVAVAAPAVERAATEKVAMTVSENAKAQTKVVTQTSDEATVEKTAKATVATDTEEVKPNVKTGFAEVLKQDANNKNTIRADILQAINQKSDGDETVKTLKNSLHNLMQNNDGKPVTSAQAADLIRQIQNGQQRASEHRAPTHLVTTLSPASNAPGQVSAATPQLAMDVQPQLNTPAWSRVVSSRVVWMAREGVQQAELKLNPASLGSVEVRLNINNDQASVTFLAQNAATRDALEQAMPRLRESLADNGMSLAHSEVGQQAHSDQSGAENNSDMHNAHSSQVIVKLDDTEDELPVEIDPAQETAELTNGVSIYA